MSVTPNRREEYEQLCRTIQNWNENRLELFEISQPKEVRRACNLSVVACNPRAGYQYFSLFLCYHTCTVASQKAILHVGRFGCSMAAHLCAWPLSSLFGCTFQTLEFEGVMRFYFQSADGDGQKVATKCIRVSSTTTTVQVVEALVQKFRPDLRMLTTPSLYTLYEVHADGGM